MLIHWTLHFGNVYSCVRTAADWAMLIREERERGTSSSFLHGIYLSISVCKTWKFSLPLSLSLQHIMCVFMWSYFHPIWPSYFICMLYSGFKLQKQSRGWLGKTYHLTASQNGTHTFIVVLSFSNNLQVKKGKLACACSYLNPLFYRITHVCALLC